MLRIFTLGVKLLLLIGILTGAVCLYIIYYYSRELPNYLQLKEYHPPLVTRIYSADGKLIEEYAREHRIFVPISNIPESLIQAFIAAEDKNFYAHSGIDLVSVIRAAITNIFHILNNERMEGGSTITQQVVKNFLLSSERSVERKIKEAILSYRISQVFSKDEILELYLNQIYLGKGAYGVAVAALNYFNKSIEELTLNEAALLAALPKAPSYFDPEKNYERALLRKNYVINRMYEDGYINAAEAGQASSLPIKLIKADKIQPIEADYYAEKVRDEVIGMFGDEYFYTAGITVITCLDSDIQKHAAEALRYGIRKYDTDKGYRGAIKNISNIQNWQAELDSITDLKGIRNYELAIVLEVHDKQAIIGLKKDNSKASVNISDMQWAKSGLKSVKNLLKVGDVIIVENQHKKYILRQIPEVNGGIIVIEQASGKVLAAEGGYDFNSSKFNRTTQAKRQPGSLIKPFIYLAALEAGAKPNDLFEDAPVEIYQGPGLPLWTPKNYEKNFLGTITLRKGLEKSRNTVTIRVGRVAGLNRIAETIKKFGINEQPGRVPSVVLGTLETTLEKMTLAYSIIANYGRKVVPHYIELIKDRKGNIIYKRDYSECLFCKNVAPEMSDSEILADFGKINAKNNLARDNLIKDNLTGDNLANVNPEEEIIADAAISYQIISLLEGSVLRGTGSAARQLKKVIAGKTGTTNDSKDTWFIGFTPLMTVGTYIGYDSPGTLGAKATGARIALPIFIEFMHKYYANINSLDFIIPESIELKYINYHTGMDSAPGLEGSIIEAFRVHNIPQTIENFPGKNSPMVNFPDNNTIPVFSNHEDDNPEEDHYDPFSNLKDDSYNDSYEIY